MRSGLSNPRVCGPCAVRRACQRRADAAVVFFMLFVTTWMTHMGRAGRTSSLVVCQPPRPAIRRPRRQSRGWDSGWDGICGRESAGWPIFKPLNSPLNPHWPTASHGVCGWATVLGASMHSAILEGWGNGNFLTLLFAGAEQRPSPTRPTLFACSASYYSTLATLSLRLYSAVYSMLNVNPGGSTRRDTGLGNVLVRG